MVEALWSQRDVFAARFEPCAFPSVCLQSRFFAVQRLFFSPIPFCTLCRIYVYAVYNTVDFPLLQLDSLTSCASSSRLLFSQFVFLALIRMHSRFCYFVCCNSIHVRFPQPNGFGLVHSRELVAFLLLLYSVLCSFFMRTE